MKKWNNELCPIDIYVPMIFSIMNHLCTDEIFLDVALTPYRVSVKTNYICSLITLIGFDNSCEYWNERQCFCLHRGKHDAKYPTAYGAPRAARLTLLSSSPCIPTLSHPSLLPNPALNTPLSLPFSLRSLLFTLYALHLLQTTCSYCSNVLHYRSGIQLIIIN